MKLEQRSGFLLSSLWSTQFLSFLQTNIFYVPLHALLNYNSLHVFICTVYDVIEYNNEIALLLQLGFEH